MKLTHQQLVTVRFMAEAWKRGDVDRAGELLATLPKGAILEVRSVLQEMASDAKSRADGVQ